jgi:hypothetical protein
MVSHFTKTPNSFWTDGWLKALNGAQLKLVLAIVRLTNGFHQDQVTAGETLLRNETGLNRSSLYDAKCELVAMGLLEVGREGQKCTYRLRFGEVYPSGNPDGSRNPEGSGNPDGYSPEIRTGGGPEIRTGPISKENRSKKSFKESSSSSASEPTPTDDDFPGNAIQETDHADDQAELIRKLRALGVDARTTEKLLQEPKTASAALELAQHRTDLANPAGFVVQVCKNGIYPRPESRLVPAPPAPPEPRPSRHATEQAADQARRDAEHAAAQLEWEQLAGQADQAELNEAETWARSQFRGVMADAPRDAPFIRAMMLEFLRARAGRQLVS